MTDPGREALERVLALVVGDADDSEAGPLAACVRAYVGEMIERMAELERELHEYKRLGDVLQQARAWREVCVALRAAHPDDGEAATGKLGALYRVRALQREVEELRARFDRITQACERWGWQHCTTEIELIEQVDYQIARLAEYEAAAREWGSARDDYARRTIGLGEQGDAARMITAERALLALATRGKGEG